MTGKKHNGNWKSDEKAIRLDERIERMIRESALKINELTPMEFFNEKERIRKKLKLSHLPGGFFINQDQIGQRLYSRR